MWLITDYGNCYESEDHGTYLWIAGQRTGHTFAWKPSNAAVKYTNWQNTHPEPNNVDGTEGCINIWTGHSYQWNDEPCITEMCFICEV